MYPSPREAVNRSAPFLDSPPGSRVGWSSGLESTTGGPAWGSLISSRSSSSIQWTEDSDEVLAWRFPMRDMEIQQGAQLTVRDTQAALFVHQGKAADLFGPGQHTISGMRADHSR